MKTQFYLNGEIILQVAGLYSPIGQNTYNYGIGDYLIKSISDNFIGEMVVRKVTLKEFKN